MNGILGWVVAVVVIIAAGVFYFYPNLIKAPTTTDQTQTGQQTATQGGTVNPAALTGTWQSTTDAKFTREFRADGIIYDRYAGDATPGIGGSWGVVLDVSKEAGLTIPAASLAGKTIIKAIWENGAETTYFSVDALTDTAMTITDLSGRGGVTVFTKVK